MNPINQKHVRWKEGDEISIVPMKCESRGKVVNKSQCDLCTVENLTISMYWDPQREIIFCSKCSGLEES